MRFPRIWFAAATVSLLAVGLATPAHAGLTTFCNGTASDVTVPGDLVVARGSSCELTNVTIIGNATVRAGGNLLLAHSQVGGDLVVQADGFASADSSTVADDTRARAAFGLYAEDSDLAGAVRVREPGFFYSLRTTHAEGIISRQGETLVESGWVTGKLRTTADRFTDLVDTVVEGPAVVVDPAGGSVVCASEIDGAMRITGSGGPVRIGADTPDTGCGSVVLAADLRLVGNTAGVVVSHAVVRGNLACAQNTPAPAGENNRVRGNGTGQCRNLAPTTAAALSGQADAATAVEAERRAVIVDEIEHRTSAGLRAALDAGPAFD